MRRLTFIILFIGAHILFIFFQINKRSQIIKQSYLKQKNEIEKNNLIKKKEILNHQLQALKHRSSIKEFAIQKLKMKNIKLNQIKKLDSDEHTP